MLLCFCTGLAYVGASTRLVQRIHEQTVLLKSGRHYNTQLQHDWLTLGPDCFTFFPIELTDNANLWTREKAWIERCRMEGGVYNVACAVTDKHLEEYKAIRPHTESELMNPSGKEYFFLSPTGTPVNVRGLKPLCEAYSLNPSHMSKVARGILTQHKGWMAQKNPTAPLEFQT